MKHYTSKVLKSVAIFLLSFPVTYIILAGILYDISLGACGGILLSPFYYIVSVTVVIAGYGIWEMRRWSWYLFIISQVLVGYENAVLVLSYGESHHKSLAFGVSLILQLGLIFRVAREIRVPYFFPKIRWWESNPRYKLSVPVKLTRKNENVIQGEILDVAGSGCFVKLRAEVSPDEPLYLNFEVFGYQIQCEGIAVWIAQSTVTHPKGVGIKFYALSRSQRRAFRAVSKRLKKISTLYRRSRYLMSQEEFLKNLEQIENND